MAILPPTGSLVPNPNPQLISGPNFYIVVNGLIIGACSSYDATHNFTVATAPQIGDVEIAEQDIMQYLGTVTLQRFAVYGARFKDLGIVQLGRNALKIGYLTFSIFDKVKQINLETYFDCLPTTLTGSYRANDFVTESATFQFTDAE